MLEPVTIRTQKTYLVTNPCIHLWDFEVQKRVVFSSSLLQHSKNTLSHSNRQWWFWLQTKLHDLLSLGLTTHPHFVDVISTAEGVCLLQRWLCFLFFFFLRRFFFPFFLSTFHLLIWAQEDSARAQCSKQQSSMEIFFFCVCLYKTLLFIT